MTLKDLLKKKDRIKDHGPTPDTITTEQTPEFTFMRSDTHTQDLITPPTFPGDDDSGKKEESHAQSRFARLRSTSNASVSSQTSSKGERRLSQRLHIRSSSRGSHNSQASVNVPADLPEISEKAVQAEDKQAQWEERATILAKGNPNTVPQSRHGRHSRPTTPISDPTVQVESPAHLGDPVKVKRSISDAQGDVSIQEAIRLHETGKLSESTAMFGRLANNNAMAQILYGLALRHGWGVEPNPTLAVKYLSQAASNSANVESSALSAGMSKGGAAKGELVLAIYELANSFRHGWGVEKDAVAARKYYECAANLGDTDAMNEVARCYEEGFGGSKDKVRLNVLILPFPNPTAGMAICKEHQVAACRFRVDLIITSHGRIHQSLCFERCETSI